MKNITRKIFSILVGSIAMGCSDTPHKTSELLVGTYTGSGSEGIYQLTMDESTGELSDLKLAAKIQNPSYLTISEGNAVVFSVGERNSGTVSSYQWRRDVDSLVLIKEVSAQGSGPCYIDYSGKRGMVAVANYVSGNVAFYDVKDEASLGNNPTVYQHEGSGPNQDRQESPHAHCSIFSKDARFVYVVDLGIDEVKAYPVGDTVGQGFTALKLQPGDGPRHLIFHPNKEYAFIINELSNTVVSAKVDVETGILTEVDRANTLPNDFSEHSQCADIHITNDGKYLYASNRGHNSLAIFSVSEEAGLELIGTESTRGDWPRNFTLSPDENFILVANQNSDNIVVFARDKDTGKLSYTGNEIAISKPICLKFER